MHMVHSAKVTLAAGNAGYQRLGRCQEWECCRTSVKGTKLKSHRRNKSKKSVTHHGDYSVKEYTVCLKTINRL